jgi:transcriptional regulator with XRE-family HTH domain/tetratricopeptide (TPR) repeat protein
MGTEPAHPAPSALTFAALLRVRRRQALLSQEQLAARSGLSVRAVRNLEQGRVRSPRGGTVRLLADALHLAGRERTEFEEAAVGPSSQAGFALDGTVWPSSGLAPYQLPPDVIDFIGRAEQEAELRELLAQGARDGSATAVVVSSVAGKAGVGKTALAVHVGHQLRSCFPDGQLYVNLRGVERQPLEATAVLARFLRALGVDGAAIPEDPEEREAMYRARLAGRRVLVVLDNAASEEQVRPLLPGMPGCAVLVTSRRRLSGLEGASLLDLEVLEPEQAIELLGRIVGAARVAAEPQAAALIIGYCGRLPLAVRVAGARLAARPQWPLARLAGLLVDERDRLDQLAAGDLEVRASLALSYQALTSEERRLFRLLSVPDMVDFAAWVAAPLLGISTKHAESLVEKLADAQLLDISRTDATGKTRYRFHDLVRVYARERAAAEEPATARQKALARILSCWLALAEQADQRLPDTSAVVASGGAARWLLPPRLVNELVCDAFLWLEIERSNLVAAVEIAAAAGLDELAWELAGCLTGFFLMRSYRDSWRRVNERALEACRKAGNQRGEAATLVAMATLLDDTMTRQADAKAMLRCALATFQLHGDRYGEAMTLYKLGMLSRSIGPYDDSGEAFRDAIAYAERAQRLACELDHTALRIDALIILCEAYRKTGRLQEASASVEQARQLVQPLAAHRSAALACWQQARLHQQMGRLGAAGVLFERSLAITRAINDRRGQARILLDFGQLRMRQNQLESADELLAMAMACSEQIADRHLQREALRWLGQVRGQQQRPR